MYLTFTGNRYKEVWFYDMRTNMPVFGKRTPLTREHFHDFESCYGHDPNGESDRVDGGELGRVYSLPR